MVEMRPHISICLNRPIAYVVRPSDTAGGVLSTVQGLLVTRSIFRDGVSAREMRPLQVEQNVKLFTEGGCSHLNFMFW